MREELDDLSLFFEFQRDKSGSKIESRCVLEPAPFCVARSPLGILDLMKESTEADFRRGRGVICTESCMFEASTWAERGDVEVTAVV